MLKFQNIVCIVIHLILPHRNLIFYVFINQALEENKIIDPAVENYKIIQFIKFYKFSIPYDVENVVRKIN